jgi:hypothetical protein
MGLLARLRGSPEPSRAGLERRVVWIVGSPRTGTTWLLNLLGKRDGFVKLDEPGIGVHLGLFLHEFFGTPAVNFAPGRALMTEARAGQADYFFCDAYADVWRPRLRELILARFAAQLERQGARDAVCLVKEPNGSQATPLLLDTLPESRLMWLLRDGRDVVDSKLDGISPGGWMGEYGATWEMTPAERSRYVEDRSHRWVVRNAAVRAVYDRLPDERRILVRYEDLRADTAGELARTFAWLGAPLAPAEAAELAEGMRFERLPAELTGSGKFVRAATPGGWRENLTADDHAIMERVMGPTLRELGYA